MVNFKQLGVQERAKNSINQKIHTFDLKKKKFELLIIKFNSIKI